MRGKDNRFELFLLNSIYFRILSVDKKTLMKRTLILFSLLVGILYSCADDTKEYKSTARELCDCMEINEVESDSREINIGVCLLDATVDLKNPIMRSEIEMQCPDLKEEFEEFIDGLNN